MGDLMVEAEPGVNARERGARVTPPSIELQHAIAELEQDKLALRRTYAMALAPQAAAHIRAALRLSDRIDGLTADARSLDHVDPRYSRLLAELRKVHGSVSQLLTDVELHESQPKAASTSSSVPPYSEGRKRT
jgi:hypothetical protein